MPTCPPYGGDADEPTYRCATCLDHAYVTHEIVRAGDRCSVAWFCDCDSGRAAHAGHWFNTIYPLAGHTRSHDERGQKRFADYLAAHLPDRIWLPGAVEHLRERHEAQRRKKLEPVAGD